jgi:hypothetical protein
MICWFKRIITHRHVSVTNLIQGTVDRKSAHPSALICPFWLVCNFKSFSYDSLPGVPRGCGSDPLITVDPDPRPITGLVERHISFYVTKQRDIEVIPSINELSTIGVIYKRGEGQKFDNSFGVYSMMCRLLFGQSGGSRASIRPLTQPTLYFRMMNQPSALCSSLIHPAIFADMPLQVIGTKMPLC